MGRVDRLRAAAGEDAARLALRIQQVVAEETNVSKVSDPLGGSYYMEWLTAELEKKAMELIESIEEKGGFIESWESGYIRSIIERSARRWKEAVDSGEKVVIGVNKYKIEEEKKIDIEKIVKDAVKKSKLLKC